MPSVTHRFHLSNGETIVTKKEEISNRGSLVITIRKVQDFPRCETEILLQVKHIVYEETVTWPE